MADFYRIAWPTLILANTITAEADLFTAFQRHHLQLLNGDMQSPANVSRIVARAKSGESVLVCCNTVARAQEMWRLLREELGPNATIELLHGRLNGRDRLDRETRVRVACGLGSNQRRPVVLVATQVVEVSLNLDLDTVYTDLAPLEALIQRFGRVNRGRRYALAPVYVFREPIPEQNLRPYDRRLLHGTLRLLEEHDDQPVDEQAVTGWLDTIYQEYAGDYAQEWQQVYDRAATEFTDLLQTLVAFNADKTLEAAFYAAFDSIEILPVAFEQEYFDLMSQRRFVDANMLLVNVSYWQYAMLKNRGKLREGDHKAKDFLERVTVVTTTYDDVLGLLFDE